MAGFRRALAALGGVHPRARLAERCASHLRRELPPEDYVVLTRYLPRDGSDDEVPVVVVGPHGVLVIEPCDDEGDLVCYQDHWYRRTALGGSHAMHDSPSNRARWNAARVKADLASGGFIYTSVEGRAAGLPLFDSMYLLGRERTLRRLRAARDRLESGA